MLHATGLVPARFLCIIGNTIYSKSFLFSKRIQTKKLNNLSKKLHITMKIKLSPKIKGNNK